ncbi:MAG: hypothetical protein WC990_08270 [Sphaerochaetaceae bacterium]
MRKVGIILTVCMMSTLVLLPGQRVTLRWSWQENHSPEYVYRYALDGGSYNEVTQKTSYTLEDVLITESHSLVVQRSLDGTHFSEPVEVSYTPPSLELPNKEPLLLEKQGSSRLILTLGTGLKLDTLIEENLFNKEGKYKELDLHINPSFMLSYISSDLLTLGEANALALKCDFTYDRYAYQSASVHALSLQALSLLKRSISERMTVGGAVGFSLVGIESTVFTTESDTWALFGGPVAQVVSHYNVTPQWSIEAFIESRLLMGDSFELYEWTLSSYLGFGYMW